MSGGSAVLVFLRSLALSAVSSVVLAIAIDRVGHRLHLADGLLGAITALGADAPEIATAVTALVKGRRDIGVGVVLGSNVFNIAVLLGFSAVVAGRVVIRPRALILNGSVGVVAAVVAGAVALQMLTPGLSVVLLVALVAPYLIVLGWGTRRIERFVRPRAMRRFLSRAVAEEERESRQPEMPPQAGRFEALAIVPSLAAIVLASVGLVDAARTLGGRWQIPDVVLGAVVLAALTGVPNLLAAVRLARRRRGSAVLTETLNSNSIIVLAGLCLPALIVGPSGVGSTVGLEAAWLIGLTIAAVALTVGRCLGSLGGDCAAGALRGVRRTDRDLARTA
jgi:cation:H+ antiporter